MDSRSTKLVRPGKPTPLVRYVPIETAVDHPGYGMEFDVFAGEWSSAAANGRGGPVITDRTTRHKAIDFRRGAGAPKAGAQGWAEPYPSDKYGTILLIWDLDC